MAIKSFSERQNVYFTGKRRVKMLDAIKKQTDNVSEYIAHSVETKVALANHDIVLTEEGKFISTDSQADVFEKFMELQGMKGQYVRKDKILDLITESPDLHKKVSALFQNVVSYSSPVPAAPPNQQRRQYAPPVQDHTSDFDMPALDDLASDSTSSAEPIDPKEAAKSLLGAFKSFSI
ncbi:hypothetical protein [Cohnella abietis]|uniref:Uncharacterized protein n=1 Tax=Cohnella abietis TaxID=2507935 RepID=A0A3T1CY18_9BACL|nr:hypothetical protein [Cohnella abietis]BBI30736.1 hypothetical protein KCTCHS21_01350 [Cohnella abietis]